MNIKLKTYVMVLSLAGMVCSGAIPEAPIILYGVVRQSIGNGVNVRRIQGTLSVTVVPPMGNPITVSAKLRNVNDQFCYVLQLPCEAVVNPQMNVSSNALLLAPMTLTYSCSNMVVNGQTAQIVGPNNLVLSQNDRGSFHRLDLQLNVLPVDADHDGIADDWEMAFFYGAADPAADPDGDGVSNLKEYLAGTNPLDPNSVLAFIDIQQDGNGVTVRWSSESDRYYRIERSSSLLEGFVPIATGVEGVPPVNEFHDPDVSPNQRAFYRIGLE